MRLVLLILVFLPSCSLYTAWFIRHELGSVHKDNEGEFVRAIVQQRPMIYP